MHESADFAERGDGMSEGGPGSTPGLRRVVTFPGLLLYGLGSTVGAGIYILTGVVAGRAGYWAPLAFALAGVVAAFTAMSFAELSSRFPRAGGALVYVQEGFRRPRFALVVGLATASAGAISAATGSLGFVAYLSEIIAIPAPLALATVVLGVAGIAAWGVKESVTAASIVTLVEIGGLLVIVAFGGVHLADAPSSTFDGTFAAAPSFGEWTLILQSVVLCFYAFLGFEDIVNVAEEVRDAPRVMPRAILWTLGISTALNCVVAAVAVLVVPPEALGEAEAPLALVLERAGGRPEMISMVALVAMLNGSLVQVVMASRILMSLAREGALPAWLGRIHPGTGTPVPATAFVAAVVGTLAATLPMERLAAATASVALAVFVLVNLSLVAVLLRERRSGGAGERRISIAIPLFGAAASTLFLALELSERIGAML